MRISQIYKVGVFNSLIQLKCFSENELNTNIQTLIPLKPETDIHGS